MIREKYINYTMTEQQKLFIYPLHQRENINIYIFECIYLTIIGRHWDSGCSILKGNYILILIISYILVIVGNKCILSWLPGVTHQR